MALTHLADTSVLTRVRLRAVRDVLRPLLEAQRVARPTIADLELGFSASNASEWDAISGALSRFDRVALAERDVHRALQVQRILAERGLKGRRLPDLLIAAGAERTGLVVLHYDNDFPLIASVTGQRHEWVVERGAID